MDDLKGFYRILSYCGGGSVFVDPDAPGWYCGNKQKADDIYLVSYRGGEFTKFLCDLLREYRDNIPLDNYKNKRTPYVRQLIEWLFDNIIEQTKKEYPRIKLEGGKYARHRYEC